jgi:hypothetical protein
LLAAISAPQQAAVLPAVLQPLHPGTPHHQPVSLAAVPLIFLLFAVACSWLTRQRLPSCIED